MPEVNLLQNLPVSKRDIKEREDFKDDNVIRESRKFSNLYFDGPRKYGYGGYTYDRRWIPVARDIVEHYNLKPGDRVLDIGCAKGFLVKDLIDVCPGLEVFGLDVSEYAVMNCPDEIVGRLHIGNAMNLPFPDDSFDCVLAVNVLHNLTKEGAISSLKEINRIVRDKSHCFVQVDAYRSEIERKIFESWVLTALYYGYPEEWLSTFRYAEYQGDYFWTILNSSGETAS